MIGEEGEGARQAAAEAAAKQDTTEAEKQFFGETLEQHADRMKKQAEGTKPKWDDMEERNAAK